MTPNIPGRALSTRSSSAFFVVVVLAAALGAYAAVSLKKLEKRSEQ